jgi:hypothetical protein
MFCGEEDDQMCVIYIVKEGEDERSHCTHAGDVNAASSSNASPAVPDQHATIYEASSR